jgi:FkbH-like protein
MSESTSLDAFLRGLDMTVICGPAASIDHARLAQLIGKTNQFNLTIRRRALQEIVALARDEQCMVFQFRLIDRFGDNGIVSAMILTPSQEEPGAMDIDTWVMSCRVFGRQLEIEALNYAVEQAKAKGVHTLYGVYVPSAKNGIVRDLYRTLGFVEVGSIALGTGASRWMLRLSSYAPPATHIARQEARHD